MGDQNTSRRVFKNKSKRTCGVNLLKKRLPIIQWLPKYSLAILVQDLIAGITVGLTAIPQGIAYAVIAGLSPEYGLYAGLMSGFIYTIFGSCKDITIGPTAILSALLAKYISNYSADFAVLAAFLAGTLELLLGIFQMGFLVDFISMPVISGFTTAAALQIASAQLKSLFGLAGSSGNYFAQSIYNFAINIKSAQLWDTVLGFITIALLILLKHMGQGCRRTDGIFKSSRWFLSLARNAVVVVIGIIVAYVLKITTNSEPLKLIGEIGSGLPTFKIPPFSTSIGNETLNFTDMLDVFGPKSIVLPLVAILESVAIAKAFAGGTPVDATQEMIALGLCNIIGSFGSSMPITGSFTRTALNNASGVQTPAGGIFTGLLIILALSLMTSTFYYIPKSTLAGLIITAMYYMIDYITFCRLWNNGKRELLVMIVTIGVCLSQGLEYGIVAGILIDAAMLMYITSRPKMDTNMIKNEKGDIILVTMADNVSYCAAEFIRKTVLKSCFMVASETMVVIDGTNLKNMDSTVASNLISLVKDLEKNSRQIVFWNFNSDLQKMCLDLGPKYVKNFVTTAKVEDIII